MQIIVVAVVGFIVGIITNLIADYLPARRLHREASANPFTSRSSILPLRPFIPRRKGGRLWPVYLWSGTIATLTGTPVFSVWCVCRRVLWVGGVGGVVSFWGWRWAKRKHCYLSAFGCCAAAVTALLARSRMGRISSSARW